MQEVTSAPLPQLAPRKTQSHKGDYGRVLIVGGSRGMAGAPSLAGKAALRSGAGLVTLAVPRSIQSTVAVFEPSYMTLGLGEATDDMLQVGQSDFIQTTARKMTALAVGPGLGTDAATVDLVHSLYSTVQQPMIVDADALNALAQHPELLVAPAGPRILTPHPGEFQRLSGETCCVESIDRAEQAARLCRRDSSGQTLVVLKGHETIVSDGQQYAVNSTGNPGMATGGTGDCLTGIIVALVGQGLTLWDAARLGVYLHGLAGDLAAAELGQISLIASDLIRFLPAAFAKLE